jgi:dihydrofolate synthase / folylpolyglutamate synthase
MITINSINCGIKSAYLSARLEVVKNSNFDLLPNGSVVYIDGAHNKHGALAVAEFLKCQKSIDGMANYLINGRTAGSDLLGFLEPFDGVIDGVAAVRVRAEYNSEHPNNIAQAALGVGIEAFVSGGIVEAIEKISQIRDLPVRILICGSLYLARDLKLALGA